MSKLFAELYKKEIVIEGEKFTLKKMSLGDQLEASKKLEENLTEGSIVLIQKSLVKWETAEGVAVEASKENLLRLRADIVMKLSEEVGAYNNLGTDKEKN